MSEQAKSAVPQPPTPQDVKRRLSVLVAPSSSLPTTSPSVPANATATATLPSPVSPSLSSTTGHQLGAELNKRSSTPGYSSAISSSGMSSTSEDESDPYSSTTTIPVSPRTNHHHQQQQQQQQMNQQNSALTVISEAEDSSLHDRRTGTTRDLSGTDSDASSIAEARSTPGTSNNGKGKKASLTMSRESTRLGESVALKSGYLMKKGERRKAWKKRWFVLRGGQLAMYKNEKEYRLLRLIPLSEIHTCSPIELKKHAHTFGIVTPKRTYYVKADSDQQVRDWCSSFERAKRDLVSSTTVTSLSETNTPGDVTPSGTISPNRTEMTNENLPISMPASSSTKTSYINSPELQPFKTFTPTTPQQVLLSTSFQSNSSSSNFGGLNSKNIGILQSPSSTNSTNRGGSIAPPNSYATDQGGALGLKGSDGHSLELTSLDRGIERVAREVDSQQASLPREQQERSASVVSRRSLTSNSDTLNLPSNTGSIGTNDYFGTRAYANPPLSPGGGGGVSSSEDEDGFDNYDDRWPAQTPAIPSSGALTSPQIQTQQQPGSSLIFAEQQQQHQTRRVPTTPLSPSIPGTGFGDPNKIILSGYLMKQGKRKNWRKRWFVLMSTRLMYSRSHMDSKIHRQIPLTRILDAIEHDSPIPSQSTSNSIKRQSITSPSDSHMPGVLPSSSGENKGIYEHCFKIITPKRTFLVCAPTEEDEIKWLAALQCLVQRKTSSNGGVVGGQPASIPPPFPPQQQQQQMNNLNVMQGVSVNVQPATPSTTSTTGGKGGLLPPVTVRPGGLGQARKRSVTDAAKEAVQEVEKRYHHHANHGATVA